ncbi:RidA family protein [Melioribacteraceae bacterium 4301-Me]|uniref:RidA family protein n=1 Tax=Pyranulibacter aquaticus TaxID=3163344 RepID=UPI0035988612
MVEEKLKELGIELQEPPKPLAAYIPAKRIDNLVYTAGQLPLKNGKLLHTGKVGYEVTEEDAVECAKLSALNCLAAIKSVIGSLNKIESIVKVTVFVSSAVGYTGQPKVANGASEFLSSVFGESGKHVRSAVGVSELPMNAPVEVEMIVKVAQ